jgi:hypothetical protein
MPSNSERKKLIISVKFTAKQSLPQARKQRKCSR